MFMKAQEWPGDIWNVPSAVASGTDSTGTRPVS